MPHVSRQWSPAIRPSSSAGRAGVWAQPIRGHWPPTRAACHRLRRWPNRTRQWRSRCYSTGEIPQFGKTIRRCWHKISMSRFPAGVRRPNSWSDRLPSLWCRRRVARPSSRHPQDARCTIPDRGSRLSHASDRERYRPSRVGERCSFGRVRRSGPESRARGLGVVVSDCACREDGFERPAGSAAA